MKLNWYYNNNYKLLFLLLFLFAYLKLFRLIYKLDLNNVNMFLLLIMKENIESLHFKKMFQYLHWDII